MRIGLAAWTSRLAGGVENYLDTLIPSLEAAGAEVAFWHEAELPVDRPFMAAPRGPVFCAARSGRDASVHELRRWKPDVLYVHGVRDADAEAALTAIAPAVRFVHDYLTCVSGSKSFSRPSPAPCLRTFGAGCLAQFFPRGCGGSSPATMWRLYTRQRARLQLLPRYRRILTHSAYMRDELGRHGLAADVVPFPVSGRVDPVTSPPLGSTWRLLFAGRMETMKGGALLVDALPGIAARCDRLHVTFAGDGRERAAWQRQADSVLGSSPRVQVEFTGWLAEADLRQCIAASHLLVFPSIWPEPFGMVGPMAGQHGVPCAAFSAGGLTEWLVEGETGHLAPSDPPASAGLAAAVIRCLRDPVHYQHLRDGARRMSQRFTMSHHLPALFECLSRV